MADINQVIYDIERCICHVPDSCRDCSHYREDFLSCIDDLLKEAMELLKKQTKTKVIFKAYDGSIETECGNCGCYLDKTYSVCPKCKKELDWD